MNKNLINKLIICIAGMLYLVSCKPKFYDAPDAPAPSAGSLTISGYIAFGGAITAGFADNALYNGSSDGGGQGAAYPNLIAKQLKVINSGLAFNQPDVQSDIGWASFTTVNGVAGNYGKRQLAYPFPGPNGPCNTAPVQPQNIQLSGLTGIESYTGDKSVLTNLAVPFISVKQVSKKLSTFSASSSSTNAYKYLNNILSSPDESIASVAASRSASLFTVWVGYDEVISLAKTGVITATGIDTTGFHSFISGLLLTPNAKGVIANIPYVDLFPIITNNNRRLTSATDPGSYPGSRIVNNKIVKRLPNVSLAGYNLALGSTLFTEDSTSTKNNYVITKGSGSLAIISTGKDFVVNSSLIDAIGTGAQDPFSARSCTPSLKSRVGTGLSSPIKNADVLDADEIKVLRGLIDAYNLYLQNIVNQYPDRLALVDLNSFFTQLSDPLLGIPYGTEIIRTNQPALGPDFGGFFSTDRTYPTPKGQALIANEFIKAINAKWGATIPKLDIDNYRANIIPN